MSERIHLATIALKSKLGYEDRSSVPFGRDDADFANASLAYGKRLPVVIFRDQSDGGKRHQKKTDASFEKISDKHGRNMTERLTSKNLIWGGDLPGDIYGAKTIKGTSLNLSIRLEPTHMDEVAFRGYGLMDDSCIERVIKASKVLRENGLPTERPVTVKKIDEILVNRSGKWLKYSISDWKNNELKRWKYSSKEVKKYLRDYDFVALERHVQVDERLADISFKRENFERFLKPIFKWLNVATRYRNGGLIEGTLKPEKFTLSKASIERYFTGYLPSTMGIYLGRVHKLGLVHNFSHSQNWSMVGTLYDLDSISGKRLFDFDDKTGQKNFAEDFRDTVDVICERIPDALEYSGISYKRKSLEDALCLFTANYMKERFGGIGPLRVFQLHTLFYSISSEDLDETMTPVWKRLYEDRFVID